MSGISKQIDEVIKAGLAPLLKSYGFKKKARNFYRMHENRTDVINIQASQSNVGRQGRFTVNVGIYFPAIAEILEVPAIKGMPKEYNCTIRKRIGNLSNEHRDIWWSVDSDKNLNEVSDVLTNKVETLCLPWLEKMSSLETAKHEVAESIPFIAAGISLHQGQESEAKTYLEECIKRKPQAKSRTVAWGEKHGLIEP